MNARLKLALRVLGAVAAFLVVATLMIIGPGIIGGIAMLGVADKAFPVLPSDNGNTGDQLRLLAIGPALSLGAIAASVAWDHRIGPKRELLFCIVLLIITGAVSGYNFAVGDNLINPAAQLFIDIILVMVSGALLFSLFAWKPERPFPRSARAVTVFMVTLCGVLIPAFYATMFLLAKLGLRLDAGETEAVLKLAAAAISLGTAAIAFRHKKVDAITTVPPQRIKKTKR